MQDSLHTDDRADADDEAACAEKRAATVDGHEPTNAGASDESADADANDEPTDTDPLLAEVSR